MSRAESGGNREGGLKRERDQGWDGSTGGDKTVEVQGGKFIFDVSSDRWQRGKNKEGGNKTSSARDHQRESDI